MSEGLYLDTARLGRMSSGARRAVHAFTDLIGEEGGSLYSERFLRHGLSTCPAPFQDRYPGLTSWSGVGELKSALRGLVGTPSDLPVLLAHRSTVLMRLAARLLFHPCRNVLVTDLGWPGYQDILADVARRTGRTISVVPLRDCILGGRAGADEVVEEVRRRYSVAGCDGLFLPAVSNLGVRLPLEAIVRSVEREHEVRFVVVDGAQDFCHAGADLRAGLCDLYLSGCHKWLGAYHPLGIACYGRRRSVGVIETTLDHLAATGEIDDPLLRFSAHLESARFEPPVETVSVVPLISCRGAVEDESRARVARPWRQRQRLDNLRVTADLVRSTGWEPLLPDPALRSGILLLRAERPAVRGLTPETLRSAFQDSSVALTAYLGGYVRVSIPDRIWADDEIGRLETAFRTNA